MTFTEAQKAIESILAANPDDPCYEIIHVVRKKHGIGAAHILIETYNLTPQKQAY